MSKVKRESERKKGKPRNRRSAREHTRPVAGGEVGGGMGETGGGREGAGSCGGHRASSGNAEPPTILYPGANPAL